MRIINESSFQADYMISEKGSGHKTIIVQQVISTKSLHFVHNIQPASETFQLRPHLGR